MSTKCGTRSATKGIIWCDHALRGSSLLVNGENQGSKIERVQTAQHSTIGEHLVASVPDGTPDATDCLKGQGRSDERLLNQRVSSSTARDRAHADVSHAGEDRWKGHTEGRGTV